MTRTLVMYLLGIMLFVVINTISFEYFISKATNNLLTILAVLIFFTTLYFLFIKPTRKILNKL